MPAAPTVPSDAEDDADDDAAAEDPASDGGVAGQPGEEGEDGNGYERELNGVVNSGSVHVSLLDFA